MQTEAAFGKNRASADAKMLAAIATPIRHRLVIFALMDVETAEVPAVRFTIPAVPLKILAGRFFIRDALEELVEADCFGFGVAHAT